MTKLTPAQRRRLDKLATYLEGLPKGYKHFDMESWVDAFDTEAEARYARENGGVASCGTSACAAGHGPAAGVLVPPRFIKHRIYVDWDGYSELFAGDKWGHLNDWCFRGAWDTVDNHHWGAAARIRYLLDKGAPPEGFSYPQRCWLSHYRPYRIDVARKASSAVAEGVGV